MVDEPEHFVELINLDCYNELYPSDVNCVGEWFYWYEEGGWREWRKDESLSLYCKGTLSRLRPK